MSKINFVDRVPEPREMGRLEQQAFQALSQKNYRRWLLPLTDHALATSALKKGKILDVACGPGLLSKEIAQRSDNFEVFGIDISKHAIELAKKNCKKFKNVKFKIGNVYKLPFANEYFDLIICKDSIHHFDDLNSCLKELRRVTKKNGYIYLQDLKRNLPAYLLKRSTPPDNLVKKLQYYSTRAAYTISELKKTLLILKFRFFKIYTRKLTKKLAAYYNKKGIENTKLKESFQSRYTAIIKNKSD